MTDDDTIERYYAALTTAAVAVRAEGGRQRIGSVSILVPHEVVIAAGLVPVKLLGLGEGIDPAAQAMMSSNMCSYILHCFSEGISSFKGRLECLIVAETCDTRRWLYEAWSHFLPDKRTYCFRAPKADSPCNRARFRQELRRLAGYLESTFNCSITAVGLRQSIAALNETRTLLQRLNRLKDDYCHRLTTKRMHQIVKASMQSSPAVFNPMLANFVTAIEKAEKDCAVGKVRIVVCGSYFDNDQICDLVERLNGVIVAENTSLGDQHYGNTITLDADLDPMDSIADYYFDKALRCAYFSSAAKTERLLELVDEHKADAVIYTSLKFCDCSAIDYGYVRRRLGERSLPVLHLELEHSMANLGSVHTRVETFMKGLRR